MKLLFDANVSHKLVIALAAEYPGSRHVREVGLRAASDSDIWDHAAAYGFAIVSKDTDFRERGYLDGSPPKVVWLDVNNADTAAIADLLRRDRSRAYGAVRRVGGDFSVDSVAWLHCGLTAIDNLDRV